jgi:hypothetical protein
MRVGGALPFSENFWVRTRINDTRWQDKDAVLREIGAPILLSPIEATLAAFREALEVKFAAVNKRINSGDNNHIKVRGVERKRRWAALTHELA